MCARIYGLEIKRRNPLYTYPVYYHLGDTDVNWKLRYMCAKRSNLLASTVHDAKPCKGGHGSPDCLPSRRIQRFCEHLVKVFASVNCESRVAGRYKQEKRKTGEETVREGERREEEGRKGEGREGEGREKEGKEEEGREEEGREGGKRKEGRKQKKEGSKTRDETEEFIGHLCGLAQSKSEYVQADAL
tara:strand:- start:725 stop:1288 length:564 start_codon:yes stop_codon:yes gene_type:complete